MNRRIDLGGGVAITTVADSQSQKEQEEIVPKNKKSKLCRVIVEAGLRAIQFPEESQNDRISNAL